ncbi:DUF1176 domain-containing protein [Pantoea sp. A4]|uniref:DUF1176 domain-containing protein n=1 Tax=Pantoea sp. A4 TaxID=1225184 RepID=UPI000474F683|nr:DUF1176 domain-containing protein [Pantoea sp. A4]
MSNRMKSLLPLCLLFSSWAQAEPLQKAFSDWQISCDNQSYCVARSFPGDSGLVMTLTRHAGADDRPQLRIDYGSAYSGAVKAEPLQDNLLLDQRRLRPDFKHWQVEPHHLTTSDPIAINEFLDQVMDAGAIQLTWSQRAQVPLSGLKAALLLMDEQQGRVDGASAWVRSGSKPMSDLPEEPARPTLPAWPGAPTALSHDEVNGLLDFASLRINTESCSLEPLQREISVAPLSDSKALILIGCERGAYNLVNLAYEVSRTRPYAARSLTFTLPFTPSGQQDRQLELMNAEFDANRGQLYTFSKGRGLGDCGVATRWQYTGNGFTLAEYAAEPICDAWHSSDDWPTLWVSQPAQPY